MRKSSYTVRERFMVTTPEAAHLLSCDTRHIRELIREGKLKARKEGSIFRVNLSSLKKYALEDD